MLNNQSDHFTTVILNEEYKIWRKNVPFLYNLVFTNSIRWPSLTIDFLSDITRPEASSGTDDLSYNLHRILYSTHTDSSEPNYLYIATIKIPDLGNHKFDSSTFDQQTQEHRIHHSKNWAHMKTDISIYHGDVEVNRARSHDANPYIIATRNTSSDVLVFDYTKHPSKALKPEVNAQRILKGHTKGGYGLEWNNIKNGLIASCGDDGMICCWDIGSTNDQSCWSCKVDKDCVKVNDISWHACDENSVGDSTGHVALWDTRTQQKPLVKKSISKTEINCIASNPICFQAVATGSDDGKICIYDLRSMHKPACKLQLSSNGIEQLKWSPHDEGIIMSASLNRCHIWDISKSNPHKDEKNRELVFVHSGHVDTVYDFCWNLNEGGIVASVSADNSLQIWQPGFY